MIRNVNTRFESAQVNYNCKLVSTKVQNQPKVYSGCTHILYKCPVDFAKYSFKLQSKLLMKVNGCFPKAFTEANQNLKSQAMVKYQPTRRFQVLKILANSVPTETVYPFKKGLRCQNLKLPIRGLSNIHSDVLSSSEGNRELNFLLDKL